MAYNADKAKSQAFFCTDLMMRLNEDVQTAKLEGPGLEHYTVMQADARRIRREILKLEKLLDRWGR